MGGRFGKVNNPPTLRGGRELTEGETGVELIMHKFFKTVLRPFLSIGFYLFPPLRQVQRYRDAFDRMPNLINPQTFNEKILRKILFDRNPLLTVFADKYESRKYVETRLGNSRYLTKIYGLVEKPEEIRALSLPAQFVMKPTHLSGYIKIVTDAETMVNSEREALAATWLEKKHYSVYNEWAYKNVKPRVLFEELLGSGETVPDDFKFYCFSGEPRFILVVRNRFTEPRNNFYDTNFHLLPMQFGVHKYENFAENNFPPPNYGEMLDVVRKLSAGVDFVRVDLYNVNGRIVFGELTNYPVAGLGRFTPDSWDREFGKYWNPSPAKRGRG